MAILNKSLLAWRCTSRTFPNSSFGMRFSRTNYRFRRYQRTIREILVIRSRIVIQIDAAGLYTGGRNYPATMFYFLLINASTKIILGIGH